MKERLTDKQKPHHVNRQLNVALVCKFTVAV